MSKYGIRGLNLQNKVSSVLLQNNTNATSVKAFWIVLQLNAYIIGPCLKHYY